MIIFQQKRDITVIFRDWVIAAKSVSLLFGTITLVPLYFLLKRFFDDKISVLAMLVFALTPTLIHRSADLVRGPVCWFFSVLGLYLFVSQLDKRNHIYLLLSGLSFLMATWARVEAVVFIIVSCFYILVVKQERKFEKLVIFTIPVAILMFIAISGLIINTSHLNIFRYEKIMPYVSAPTAGYENLRLGLEHLRDQPLGPIGPWYIDWVRHLVWFIALGILLTSMVHAFFYPFFIVFIAGLVGIRKRIKRDMRIPYFAFLSVGAFIILYLMVLRMQTMETRYVILFILSSSIFMGFGLEKVIRFIKSKFKLKESFALSIVCLLILACSLPKNLKPREADKLVFKEIGELIAGREGNKQEILVVTSLHSIRWISFYANVNYKGAPCPQKNYDLDNIIGKGYGEFVRNLRKRGIKYFLWEQKHWPKKSSYFISSQNSEDFIKLGDWSHPDTGRMILFRVI